VRKWHVEGRLPGITLPGLERYRHRRFQVSDVRAFMVAGDLPVEWLDAVLATKKEKMPVVPRVRKRMGRSTYQTLMERAVAFLYTDFRGTCTRRRVLPRRIWWGHTSHAPGAQWLLDGWDVEQSKERTFVLSRVREWRAAPTPANEPPMTVVETDAGEEIPLPERKSGEAPYRCLMCTRYKCHEPLSICPDCRTDYKTAKPEF
jgi:hypothetical protein